MHNEAGTFSETEQPGIAGELSEITGLSIAWCADEPDRVGEVALVPGGAPGPVQLLGRGAAGADDPCGRLAFVRIRGGRLEPRPPLENRRLSRAQLRLRVLEDGLLEVENAGRLRLEHGGVPADRIRVGPGDAFQLGRQFLFLVVRRRVQPPGAHETSAASFPFGEADENGIVGESSAIWALRDRIAFVGPRRGHVLVVGASGTGKELVAHAVHAGSARRGRPLSARNAATIPEGIVDAELFGNARNYPNVGTPERAGLVGDADGTSLFLDEFGELRVSVQAHFLRVLDSGEYQRLGDSRLRHSDFRLIAATNRPTSVLKEDVLARMTFRIDVPGLEARKDDVPLLARHLVKRLLAEDPALASRFTTPPLPSIALVRQLVTHGYTTHARELEGMLWRAIEKSPTEWLEPAPEGAAPASIAERPEAGWRPTGVDGDGPSAEAVQRCLDAHNGVLEDTWRDLGLSSRHALARLVRKHRIEVRRRPKGFA